MKKFSFLIILTAFATTFSFADTPQTINYQGRLTDLSGNPVVDGLHSVTFSLYEIATGGTAKWNENLVVQTEQGYFHAILGAIDTFSSKGADFSVPYYLGVRVGIDPEMTPRQPLQSVPYSNIASTVVNGSITTEKMKPTYISKSSDTNHTLTSTTPFEIPEITSTIDVSTPSILLIIYSGEVGISNANVSGLHIHIEVDGVRITNSGLYELPFSGTGDNPNTTLTLHRLYPVDSGIHTITVIANSQVEGDQVNILSSDFSVLAFGR